MLHALVVDLGFEISPLPLVVNIHIPVARIWRMLTPKDVGKFQNPKMEGLYHKRHFFVGMFPYIGLY